MNGVYIRFVDELNTRHGINFSTERNPEWIPSGERPVNGILDQMEGVVPFRPENVRVRIS